MRPPIRYQHTQIGWVTIGAVGLAIAFVVVLFGAVGLGSIAIAIGAVLALLLACFGSLTVTVTRDDLLLRFGLGLIRKRIALADIRSFSPVENPWWYGWGIRFTPHGPLWNVAGRHAVELAFDGGKRFRVGTDEPQLLHRALVDALGEPRPLSAEEIELGRARARRYWLIVLPIALVILIAVGTLLWAEARPPTASVDASGLHVASAVYSVDVPLEDITDVRLLNEMPRILARTNGTGLGQTLRGHFRVDGLGEGRLFLELGHPPYLLVRTNETFVVVGYEDAASTLRLRGELLARRGR